MVDITLPFGWPESLSPICYLPKRRHWRSQVRMRIPERQWVGRWLEIVWRTQGNDFVTWITSIGAVSIKIWSDNAKRSVSVRCIQIACFNLALNILKIWKYLNNNAIKNDKIEQINEWDERSQCYGWILHKILDRKVRLGKAIDGVIPTAPGPKSDIWFFENGPELGQYQLDLEIERTVAHSKSWTRGQSC